ncbi:MAG: DNA polymerase IV [Defluviimonas denitrificans]
MPALCRDCLTTFQTGPRCPACRSPRVVAHPELLTLSIAHMDCDAFYASVEKRDNPDLRGVPVIVGGAKRGVVSTCCYLARIKGVRSAMPMFQALRLCPEAVVIKPRGSHYAAVSRQIRALMDAMTPVVEPLSLDEAFLDLTGTERLHKAPPAVLLARLLKRMEEELGLTGSVGLSHNKFLAKIASDLDKPRGFSVIGRADTAAFLKGKPVRMIWGVGAASQAQLDAAGIRTFDDLARWDRKDLIQRFGQIGDRLWHLARGEDFRRVTPNEPMKSISAETTFDEDIADRDLLDGHVWRLSEKVTDRAKAKGLAGRTVTLKLKRADFTTITRRHTLREPTQMADRLYREAADLLAHVGGRDAYRLIGVGLSDIVAASAADLTPDLLDPDAKRRAGRNARRMRSGAVRGRCDREGRALR